MFKDILPMIEEVAPFIAKAIAMPYDGALPLVLNLLSQAFDHKGKGLDSLAQKISQDPNASDKLAQVQADIPDEIKKYIKETLRLPDEAEVNIKLKWDK